MPRLNPDFEKKKENVYVQMKKRIPWARHTTKKRSKQAHAFELAAGTVPSDPEHRSLRAINSTIFMVKSHQSFRRLEGQWVVRGALERATREVEGSSTLFLSPKNTTQKTRASGPAAAAGQLVATAHCLFSCSTGLPALPRAVPT